MTFQMRFAKVVVQKRVVLEPCEVELLRREIQRSLQNPESILFAEEFDMDEIADLKGEALHLLVESNKCFRDLSVEENDLSAR